MDIPMGDLSKNISREEMRCHCEYSDCKRTPVDGELVDVLQELVDHYSYLENQRSLTFKRVSLHINSGHRCAQHNTDVTDGKGSGIHVTGMAADFWMEYVYADGSRERVDDESIQEYLEHRYPDQYGIGRYPRPEYPKNDKDTDMPRTHFDVRDDARARWTG